MKDQELDIDAINLSHAHRIDKWFRMYAGLSSELMSYESGVIELEIRKSAKWTRSHEATARQFADTWKRSNQELSEAVAFLVHLYDRKVPPGFIQPASSASTKEGRAALAETIKRIVEAPVEDIMLATVRGRFDDPLPPGYPGVDRDTTHG